ncbi:hypothetical protein, partial [Photobacterium leiognathi]|uniref:hypothetical protein n=1 Tax=Photobacterium leiognathi TaxID=553611 RepID=UPI002733349B
CTSFGFGWVFNQVIPTSVSSFRIYRETLSRFRAPLHYVIFSIIKLFKVVPVPILIFFLDLA